MSKTLDKALGKLDAMPTVGGDPIVESGSNADGEWTRWADGTQIVNTGTIAMGAIDNVQGSLYRTTQGIGNFPKAFLPDGSYISVFAHDTGNASVFANARNINTTQWECYLYFYQSAGVREAKACAFGRWK